ncbi:MAG: hypothetical protein MZV65_33190 [Chromatiales bacterium]|nr:hypothetical protein [Chromatiales bacterium]
MTAIVTWNVQCGLRPATARVDLARIARRRGRWPTSTCSACRRWRVNYPGLPAAGARPGRAVCATLFPGYEVCLRRRASTGRRRQAARRAFGNVIAVAPAGAAGVSPPAAAGRPSRHASTCSAHGDRGRGAARRAGPRARRHHPPGVLLGAAAHGADRRACVSCQAAAARQRSDSAEAGEKPEPYAGPAAGGSRPMHVRRLQRAADRCRVRPALRAAMGRRLAPRRAATRRIRQARRAVRPPAVADGWPLSRLLPALTPDLAPRLVSIDMDASTDASDHQPLAAGAARLAQPPQLSLGSLEFDGV